MKGNYTTATETELRIHYSDIMVYQVYPTLKYGKMRHKTSELSGS